MKKGLLVLSTLLCLGGLASCGGNKPADSSTPGSTTSVNTAGSTTSVNTAKKYKIAMVTDYGDITDESFNQATYEGCDEWAKANGYEFTYKKPASNSDADRVASVEGAIEDGYNLIVMPGYAFAPTIDQIAEENSDVKFVALDVALSDLLAAHYSDYYTNPNLDTSGYKLPSNVYCAVYQEELAGYMAGYAAVKEGYTKLGFLGGMAVPAVVRYGYGFVQGANDAAGSTAIDIKYAYGNQFYGDADIKARTDTWYAAGTEVVFACGGGIYTSACESAQAVNGKVIGVDVDQSATIDNRYGKGMCITSAMKGLSATVKAKLTEICEENKFVSEIETLGLVSKEDVTLNYVQLPLDTWSMTKFTKDDYKALVAKLYDKEITVSNAIDVEPTVSATTTVDYQGNIK